MYKTFVFIIVVFIFFSAKAQNLVMNPSFEEYWQCPTAIANLRISDCKYVFDPQCITQPIPCVSTSDYFNACATVSSNANVPSVYGGYQTAKSGVGFLGIGNLDTTGYREYVQIKLSKVLSSGSTNQFSFFVNLANISGITTNQIGVKFTADSVRYTSSQYLWQIMQADWISNTYITDTTDWQELKGEYVALGGEQWMIIGIFYPTKIFPSIVFNPNACFPCMHYCYFYIDDAVLEEKEIATAITIPNVISANNDGVNDVWQPKFVGYRFNSLLIFNRWGNLMYSSTEQYTWDGTSTTDKKVSDGVYYYLLSLTNSKTTTIENYKGFIQLFR